MSQTAKLSSKAAESVLPMTFLVPAVLGVNTMLLFALDFQGAVPQWVKLAATIFLSF